MKSTFRTTTYRVLSNTLKESRNQFVFLLLVIFIILPNEQVFAQIIREGYSIENANIEVMLDKDKPMVLKYVLKENGSALLGNVRDTAPEILIYHGGNAVSENLIEISYASIQTGNNYDVPYHATVSYDDKTAVEFDLVYSLTNESLAIELKNVVEYDDFYLIHVILPDLMTVDGSDTSARLAIPAETGRLIHVGKASAKDYEYEIDWLNSILAGFAYHSKVIGILDTKSIENHSVVSVFEQNGNQYGSFSMKLMHRLKEYDLHEFGPVIPVTDPRYLLKVQPSCQLTISIVGDYDQDGEISWVDGTKVLRKDINAVPNPFYADKLTAKIFIDRPGDKKYLTFDEILKRIREFANETDSAGRIIYLAGWQYEGHDSGYPSVDKVNERLGGLDGLTHLIGEARKYNAIVSFHDNYDDAYMEHPGWDPDIISRDPQGDLMKGGNWGGKQSYLISSYKYAMKSGLKRVRSTLEKYPVRDTYHVDVLAGGYNDGRKYDFNPESPAGARKNFEGKLKIIHEFNKQGIDITTEDFSGFFVGHVGSFLSMIAFNHTYFENEEHIPLLPFVYHGKTSYGMKISDRSNYLKTLLYGQTFAPSKSVRSAFSGEDYILDVLPKLKLYGKPMKSYQKNEGTERIVFEDGSTVEVNIKSNTYSVTLHDGAVVAENFTSFIPVAENIFFACSREGGPFSYPVPNGWTDEEKITLLRMNSNGSRKDVKFDLADGKLKFESKPGATYKVIYGE